jgi:hypothetical protein
MHAAPRPDKRKTAENGFFARLEIEACAAQGVKESLAKTR